MDIQVIVSHLLGVVDEVFVGKSYQKKDLESGFSAVLSVCLNNKDVDIKNKAKMVLEKLNLITGKNFKTTSKTNQGFVIARLKEGYTGKDFIHVMKVKTQQWKGTEMEMYLRPETLFCGKHFDSYLNEKLKTEQSQGESLEDRAKRLAQEAFGV